MTNIFGAQNTGLPHDTFSNASGKPRRDLAHFRQTEIVVAEHDRVRHAAKLLG
jgi:hypothetical protein